MLPLILLLLLLPLSVDSVTTRFHVDTIYTCALYDRYSVILQLFNGQQLISNTHLHVAVGNSARYSVDGQVTGTKYIDLYLVVHHDCTLRGNRRHVTYRPSEGTPHPPINITFSSSSYADLTDMGVESDWPWPDKITNYY